MYQSSFIRYERRGDVVVPVRVTKSWVEYAALNPGGTDIRRFTVSRVTEVRWPRRPDLFVNTAPGAVKSEAPMRADLLAQGHIKPAGVGTYLELDEAAWRAAA